MPLDTPSTNPNTEASRSNSFLSRFSSPLSKRARNVFDFKIEPENEFATYSPGDKVKGNIILSVLKGFDITHLVIALHGYAKVFKHQSERRPTPGDLIHSQPSQDAEYLGNGLASLFQDEQVLCGSGFLKKQTYQFGFVLQFPSHSLPTSIDFERGTITYFISATVTRPTTISPTITKTCAVKFRDRIDIGPLYSPKTRVISLEPINRRGKVKKVKTSSSISTQDASASLRREPNRKDTQTSEQLRIAASIRNPPLSPAPSEDTIATTNTASSESMQVVENGSPVRKASPQASETRSSMTSSSGQTITAVVELPRHGAIPGDMLPIHVSVTHTKPNVRGVVIATLYRTVRVDMYPVVPVRTKGKDKRKEHDDVYEPSRTGLGGLYFANNAPSSAFRKDLSQVYTMMIINPQTLTSDVTTKLKVPVDDIPPTMTNIPGGMISFTYHVEVVIDIAGKLGESRFFPSLTNNGPTFTTGPDNGYSLTSNWSRNILDTTSLRRTKSVVTSILPVTIGTKDSHREHRQIEQKNGQRDIQDPHWQQDWDEDMYGPNGYDPDGSWDPAYYYDEFGNPLYNDDDWYGHDEHYQQLYPQQMIPPPHIHEEGDEKSRLRQQEELLMPSQPPAAGSSAGPEAFAPSAPSFDNSRDTSHIPMAGPSTRPHMTLSTSRASARSGETIIPSTITPPPSLPEDESQPFVAEDKQELERQRLMAQASAPPVDGPDAGPSDTASAPPVASAPNIDEEEEYISQTLRNEHLDSESLPQYHR